MYDFKDYYQDYLNEIQTQIQNQNVYNFQDCDH